MGEQAFGEFLVTQGVLSADGLRRALDAQRSLECRLGTVLLDLGLLSERALLKALGRFCSSRTVDAAELTSVPPEVLAMVPARFALRHEVVPFRLDGRTLSVATIDPEDLLVEDELKLMTDCRIASFVALEVRLDEALARYYLKQLPVQMVSLLKRLPGAVSAAGVSCGAGLGGAAVDQEAEVLTERVEVPRVASPDRRARIPGRATPRSPDDSAVVEVSADELAAFPSLRRALEDSGTGMVTVKSKKASADGPPGHSDDASPPADVSSPVGEEPRGAPEAASLGDRDMEARLDRAAQALQKAEMREDVADAVFAFCAPYLRRRVLLALREGVVIGWRGEGARIDPLWVRSLSIPLDEPSVFVDVVERKDTFLGRLTPTHGNQELLLGLGGEQPSECVVLPIFANKRPVCFLYGDNMDQGLDGLPLEALLRLAIKAGLAFQVYLLRNKIRRV